jgi:peptide/nickel transport system permease protein
LALALGFQSDWGQVLPNVLAPTIVQATLTMAIAVLAEASLAFLGLGQLPPAPSWGAVLDVARQFLSEPPWMAFWPGLAIIAHRCRVQLGETLVP